MPAIESAMLKSVFYIYPSREDAEESTENGGTGFIIWIESDVNPNVGFLYGVTNWHVVFNAKPNPIIRINTKYGKFDLIETKYEDWIRHPNGDDVAIINLVVDEVNHSYGNFKREHFLTDDFIREKNIGPGDEVVMIGRFRVQGGKKRNLPMAMFGYISMMVEEPIYNPETHLYQESYLVEMRSISGFSGSPVQLYIPPGSKRAGSNLLSLDSYWMLLGISWGYINVPEKAEDDSGKKYYLKLNSSMAGVVPIQKIIDLIDSEEQMRLREETNKFLKEIMDNSGISTTNAKNDKKEEDNEGLTKETFDKVLSKIARPLKKDDEEKKGT